MKVNSSELVISRHIVEQAEGAVQNSVAGLAADHGRIAFSGVFATHNGRYFVVTAAHCLKNIADINSLKIFSKRAPLVEESILNCTTIPPLQQLKDRLPRADLAAIELSESYRRGLNPDWIDISKLNRRLRVSNSQVLLYGFPYQRAERSIRGGKRALILSPLIYSAPVSSRSPGNLEASANRKYDFFVEYDPDETLDPRSGSPLPKLHPAGMSGCGVFLIQPSHNRTIWSPEQPELCGIQVSFLGNRKLLRCTRIRRLVHLLRTI